MLQVAHVLPGVVSLIAENVKNPFHFAKFGVM